MSLPPIPGDPGTVEAVAAGLQSAADRMDAAARTLARLSSTSEYRSDAVDTMKANGQELATVMTDASTRYRGAGDALARYAPVLRHAQQEALAASATLSGTDVTGARMHVVAQEAEFLLTQHNPLVSEEDRSRIHAETTRAHADLERQEAAAHAAQARYDEAVADVETAAAAAAGAIHDADEASRLNDSFWDDFQGWKEKYGVYLTSFLENLSGVLGIVALVTGIVGTIVALIPGGQLIGLALIAVSIGATVLAQAADNALFLLGDRAIGEQVVGSLLSALSVLGGVGKLAKFAVVGKEMPVTEAIARELPGISFDLGLDGTSHAVLDSADSSGVQSVWTWRPFDPTQYTTHDAGVLEHDFSNVNADRIVDDAFTRTAAPATCSEYASTFRLAA